MNHQHQKIEERTLPPNLTRLNEFVMMNHHQKVQQHAEQEASHVKNTTMTKNAAAAESFFDRCMSKMKPLAAAPAAAKAGSSSAIDTPMRPLSAYNIFFQNERDRILRSRRASPDGGQQRQAQRARHGNNNGNNGNKMGFAELARSIGRTWKKLDRIERMYYEDLADKERRRYERELAEYHHRRRHLSAAVGDSSGSSSSSSSLSSSPLLSSLLEPLRDGTLTPSSPSSVAARPSPSKKSTQDAKPGAAACTPAPAAASATVAGLGLAPSAASIDALVALGSLPGEHTWTKKVNDNENKNSSSTLSSKYIDNAPPQSLKQQLNNHGCSEVPALRKPAAAKEFKSGGILLRADIVDENNAQRGPSSLLPSVSSVKNLTTAIGEEEASSSQEEQQLKRQEEREEDDGRGVVAGGPRGLNKEEEDKLLVSLVVGNGYYDPLSILPEQPPQQQHHRQPFVSSSAGPVGFVPPPKTTTRTAISSAIDLDLDMRDILSRLLE